MSVKKWIKKALGVKKRRVGLGPHHKKAVRVEAAHKGALHRQLGVPAGEKIPLELLKSAAKGGSTKLARRARLAVTLRKMSAISAKKRKARKAKKAK